MILSTRENDSRRYIPFLFSIYSFLELSSLLSSSSKKSPANDVACGEANASPPRLTNAIPTGAACASPPLPANAMADGRA